MVQKDMPVPRNICCAKRSLCRNTFVALAACKAEACTPSMVAPLATHNNFQCRIAHGALLAAGSEVMMLGA